MAAPSSNRLPTTAELFCYPPPPRMGFIGEKGDQKACKHEELRAQLGTHFGLRCNKWSLQGPNKSGPNFANPSQIAHTIWVELDFARKVTSTELCKFWCEKIAFSGILRTSQIKPWATSPISSTPSRIGVNPGLSCRPLIFYFFPQVELTWHGKMGLTSKKHNVSRPMPPIRGGNCHFAKQAIREIQEDAGPRTTRGQKLMERTPPVVVTLDPGWRRRTQALHRGGGHTKVSAWVSCLCVFSSRLPCPTWTPQGPPRMGPFWAYSPSQKRFLPSLAISYRLTLRNWLLTHFLNFRTPSQGLTPLTWTPQQSPF